MSENTEKRLAVFSIFPAVIGIFICGLPMGIIGGIMASLAKECADKGHAVLAKIVRIICILEIALAIVFAMNQQG